MPLYNPESELIYIYNMLNLSPVIPTKEGSNWKTHEILHPDILSVLNFSVARVQDDREMVAEYATPLMCQILLILSPVIPTKEGSNYHIKSINVFKLIYAEILCM